MNWVVVPVNIPCLNDAFLYLEAKMLATGVSYLRVRKSAFRRSVMDRLGYWTTDKVCFEIGDEQSFVDRANLLRRSKRKLRRCRFRA